MKKLTALLLCFILNHAYSQIDERFQNIMSAALSDERISNKVFDHRHIKEGAVYMFMSKELEFWLSAKHTTMFNLPTRKTGMAQVVEMADNKQVFVFDDV